jgi:hypothetical protein
LLSPIPVLAWPLCAFVHHQQGSDAARAVLRGILEGAYGVLVFYTIVAGGLGRLSAVCVLPVSKQPEVAFCSVTAVEIAATGSIR